MREIVGAAPDRQHVHVDVFLADGRLAGPGEREVPETDAHG
jgi:hypothetical protein